jgi:hypothetical protein
MRRGWRRGEESRRGVRERVRVRRIRMRTNEGGEADREEWEGQKGK